MDFTKISIWRSLVSRLKPRSRTTNTSRICVPTCCPRSASLQQKTTETLTTLNIFHHLHVLYSVFCQVIWQTVCKRMYHQLLKTFLFQHRFLTSLFNYFLQLNSFSKLLDIYDTMLSWTSKWNGCCYFNQEKMIDWLIDWSHSSTVQATVENKSPG